MCVVLKDVLKRGHCFGNLCNDPCLNVYKGVLSFEKFFNVLKVVLKLCCEVCFERYQGLFCKFGQVTKSYLP